MKADFSGYATKNGLLCSDGRIIHADAFKEQDKQRVPILWSHQHDDNASVLGYGVLQHREDGTYIEGYFNDTESGQNAKKLVQHGDLNMLSIYADKLIHKGQNVMRGVIREVSLVLLGANPGAYIENVSLAHGDSTEIDAAIIYTGEFLSHSDSTEVAEDEEAESTTLEHSDNTEGATMADTKEKTVADVVNSMSEEQQNALYYLVGEAVDGADKPAATDGADIKHSEDTTDASDVIQHSKEGTKVNVFDQTETKSASKGHLSHSQVRTIVKDAIKMGSFKESFLSHAGEYGIDNIELMFPDAKAVGDNPELLARQAEWVPKVLNATKHSPFAKIKSLVADLTAPEARAKGYIKGNEKTEEVIALLRRTTSPTTVYKKQKLDRDDIIDITDFDVIAWLKWEIRFMLNEEIARAILIGDGRSTISVDKIKDPAGVVDGIGIRSILNDNPLYAIRVDLEANVSADSIVDEITRSRTDYRGSGTPTMYTTDKVLTDLLLLKDGMKRRLYETPEALASALRVKEIVAVEVLAEESDLLCIIVNLSDYNIGTNKGGELTFFEDFDIDFNQNKYLLESRLSGALTKPKSAIVVRRAQGTLATVAAPSFNGTTNVITVPAAEGVNYFIDGEIVTGTVEIIETTEIVAAAKATYYLAPNSTKTWTFTYTE